MTIGVCITLQILLDTRTNLGDKIFKIKESRIHSMISVIYFIVGILVISSGYLLVNNDPMMAYMALICILTGLIILMIFGTGFFMEKYSESKYYKKHILAWNDWYCYIKKHGFRMLMQILLGIILIFNTFLMLRGTVHDRYMARMDDGSYNIALKGTKTLSFDFQNVDDFINQTKAPEGHTFDEKDYDEVK